MRSAFLATLAIALITIFSGVRYYSVKSDLMKTRKTIDDQWLYVALALQQRADLVPRLVETVKAISPNDAGVCAALTDARAALAHARVREETIAASGQLDTAYARLLLASESFSQTKPKPKFVPLQDELAEAENRFLLARRKYNETLEHYNVEIQKFPANIVAGIAGFTRNDAYFKTEPGVREVPKVQR